MEESQVTVTSRYANISWQFLEEILGKPFDEISLVDLTPILSVIRAALQRGWCPTESGSSILEVSKKMVLSCYYCEEENDLKEMISFISQLLSITSINDVYDAIELAILSYAGTKISIASNITSSLLQSLDKMIHNPLRGGQLSNQPITLNTLDLSLVKNEGFLSALSKVMHNNIFLSQESLLSVASDSILNKFSSFILVFVKYLRNRTLSAETNVNDFDNLRINLLQAACALFDKTLKSASLVKKIIRTKPRVITSTKFDSTLSSTTQGNLNLVTFTNDHHSVKFPNGPFTVCLDYKLSLEEPARFSFSCLSGGGSLWCMGLVPVSCISEGNYLLKKGVIGVASDGNAGESLVTYPIHQKVLVIDISTVNRTFKVFVDGKLLHEAAISEEIFPCYFGFCGYCGSTIDILPGPVVLDTQLEEIEVEDFVEEASPSALFDPTTVTNKGIVLKNELSKATFPMGPSTVYLATPFSKDILASDHCVLTFDLVASGNSAWCIGLVPSHELKCPDYLWKSGIIGITSGTIDKAKHLLHCDCHNKSIRVVLDVGSTSTLTISTSGTQLYRKELDESVFPCRIGICAQFGVSVELTQVHIGGTPTEEKEEKPIDSSASDISFDTSNWTVTVPSAGGGTTTPPDRKMTFKNDNLRAEFPMGPCAAYLKPVINITDKTSLRVEVKSVGSNSRFVVGLVPGSALSDADFLMKRGKYGKGSQELSGNTCFGLHSMHGKDLIVEVNTASKVFELSIDGAVFYSVSIADASFPLRIGFCGFGGSVIEVIKQSLVPHKPKAVSPGSDIATNFKSLLSELDFHLNEKIESLSLSLDSATKQSLLSALLEGFKSYDYLSLIAFDTVMSVALDAVLLDDTENNEVRQSAVALIKRMAESSKAHILLSHGFCLPLIKRSFQEAKESSEAKMAILNRSEATAEAELTSEMTQSIFDLLDSTQNCGRKYIDASKDCFPNKVSVVLVERINRGIVRCHDSICDMLLSSGSLSEMIANALYSYLATDVDRWESPIGYLFDALSLSINDRKTAKDMIIDMWRKAVEKSVGDKCAKFTSLVTKQSRSEFECLETVDALLQLHVRAHDIAKMEFKNITGVTVVTDTAFLNAAQQLKKPVLMELSKGLAVRLSQLLDTTKSSSRRAKLNVEIRNLCSLAMSLLDAFAMTEFSHYYELLMTRRLLRSRFVSLDEELVTLNCLPAMPRAHLMLHDIQQSSKVSESFRRHLSTLLRTELRDHCLKEELKTLVQHPELLKINMLAKSVWNSAWLYPKSYATIKLPRALEFIKREFSRSYRDGELDKSSASNDDKIVSEEKRLTVTTASGSNFQSMTVPGVTPYWESNGSRSFSVRVPPGRELVELKMLAHNHDSYSPKSVEILVVKGFTEKKVKSLELPRDGSMATLATGADVAKAGLAGLAGDLWIKVNITANHSNGSNSRVSFISMKTRKLSVSNQSKQRLCSKPQRLDWSIGAGSVTIQVAQGSPVRHALLEVSEPQAVVLFALLDAPYFTKETLCEYTGLSLLEAEPVLESLSTAEAPVVEISSAATASRVATLSLSNDFIVSVTSTERYHSEPLILPSVAVAGDSAFSGTNSVQKWRNELIDAAILRVLKKAASKGPDLEAKDSRAGSLSLTSSVIANSSANAANLPLDLLLDSVKAALSENFEVQTTDILRRTERLEAAGFIFKEKNSPNSVPFRAVSYRYLPPSDQQEEGQQQSQGDASAISTALSQSSGSEAIIGPSISSISSSFEPMKVRPVPMQRMPSAVDAVSQSSLQDHPLMREVETVPDIDSVSAFIQETVRKVSEVTCLSSDEASAILLRNRWDSSLAIESFVNRPHATRLEAGLPSEPQQPLILPLPTTPTTTATDAVDTAVTCNTCMEERRSAEMLSLHCKHYQCESCWSRYLQTVVTDTVNAVSCPFHCNCAVPISTVSRLLGEERCNAWLQRSFVECQRGKVSFCKNPKGCQGIVFLEEELEQYNVCCAKCSLTFCPLCDMPPHSPASCHLITRWIEKEGYIGGLSSDEMATRKTKLLTTSPCPRCCTRIEKNEGCTSMKCANPACKFEFCWGCRREAHSHASTCSIAPLPEPSFNFEQHNKSCSRLFERYEEISKEASELRSRLTGDASSTYLYRVVALTHVADAYRFLAYCEVVAHFLDSTKLNIAIETLTQLVEVMYEQASDDDEFQLIPSGRFKASVCLIRTLCKEICLLCKAETVSVSKVKDSDKTGAANPKIEATKSNPSENSRGNPVSKGVGDRIAGDTGLPAKDVWYCGNYLFECRCGGCDGRCGPRNGCPCNACKLLLPSLSSSAAAAVPFTVDSLVFGQKAMKTSTESSGSETSPAASAFEAKSPLADVASKGFNFSLGVQGSSSSADKKQHKSSKVSSAAKAHTLKSSGESLAQKLSFSFPSSSFPVPSFPLTISTTPALAVSSSSADPSPAQATSAPSETPPPLAAVSSTSLEKEASAVDVEESDSSTSASLSVDPSVVKDSDTLLMNPEIPSPASSTSSVDDSPSLSPESGT